VLWTTVPHAEMTNGQFYYRDLANLHVTWYTL